MTFEEAKKILKKEFVVIGFHKSTEPFEFDASKWFEHEKPSVLEAFRTLGKEGYYVTISGHDYDMRKKRLEKENEDWKSCHEMQNRAIATNNIAFRNEKNRLGKEIDRLNKIIHKKNMKIEEFRKESSRHLRGKIKVFYENIDLEGKLKDKDAVLADVAEELRLSKIREKNLTELCQKYIKANEELKEKLADKVVDKIDAQALKSAESALAEKDEVISDLGKELAATKKELEEKTKRVEIVRNASKEYCDYGVAANEFIKKLANLYVIAGNKGTISNEMFERCKNYQSYGFPATCNKETMKEINGIARGKENKKPRIPTPKFSEEELMKIQEKVVASYDKAEEGGDQSAIIVQCDNGITLSKEEAEIIERCTKNGTELHYSEKDGLTYTNMYGEEMPISYLRGMFHVFTDEEIKNMKK